jgi:hypothetical protein
MISVAEQLSFLARPEVAVAYHPWEWLCAGDETTPFRGGFCAYLCDGSTGVGFGRSADEALVDLARDLRGAVDVAAADGSSPSAAQVLMAVRRLDPGGLAGFLRNHTREAALVIGAQRVPCELSDVFTT